MTMIRLDPNELNQASIQLGRSAAELGELGAQLASCVSCPMPPMVAADIGALVSSADALLDQLGAVLHREAVDLARRAVISSMDSLAAATGTTRESVAAQLGVDLATLGVTPAAAAATSPLAGSGVVGGSSSGFTLVDSAGQVVDPSTLLGGSTLGGVTTSLPSPALGSGMVGGNSWGSSQITILDETGRVADPANFRATGSIGGVTGPVREVTLGPLATPRGIGPNIPAGTPASDELARRISAASANSQAFSTIRYNEMAIGMNNFGLTPPERHNWS